MDPLVIASGSTEYLKVPISATASGAAIDPTTSPVDLALTPSSVEPVSGDWKVASWENEGSVHEARLLVGPLGSVTLAPGSYDLWVRVRANMETPVLRVATLTVV